MTNKMMHIAYQIQQNYDGEPHFIEGESYLAYLDDGEIVVLIRADVITGAEFAAFAKFVIYGVMGIPPEDMSMATEAVYQNFTTYRRPAEIDWAFDHLQAELYGDANRVYVWHIVWSAYINGERG